MNVQEFAELAAGYALDALSPEDAQAFEVALVEHPEWASIAETDAATVAALADGVAEVEPPAYVRGALLAAIAGSGPIAETPTLEAVAPPVEPALNTEAVQTVARRTWTRGLLALAASFVLLIALGTVAVTIGDRLHTPAAVAALEEIQSAEDAQSVTAEVEGGGTATAYWSESLGQAVVQTSGVDVRAPRRDVRAVVRARGRHAGLRGPVRH